MERGKAHTIVGATHHEERRPLDLAEGAAGCTAHQRQGIARGGGGIARGREELRAGGRKRAHGRLEAHGGKIVACACVPPAFWCLF